MLDDDAKRVVSVDTLAVDVKGFYSQIVDTAQLIPDEIPNSPLLYILTTSEGRDKLFKLLQYSLKIAICLLNRNFLPASAANFSAYWSLRLGGNVQTIRNGRAMFKLGRWIITIFHLQTAVRRLLLKHCPHRLFQLEEGLGKLREAVLNFLSSTCAVITGNYPAESRRRLRDEDESQFINEEMKRAAEAAEERSSSAAVASTVEMRRRDMFQRGLPSIFASESEQAHLPAVAAYPNRWKKAIDDFSTPFMVILIVRCLLSIYRNVIRDAIFLSQKHFIAMRIENRPTWQSHATMAWFASSALDLILNSSRLMDAGWFAYTSARRSTTARCNCFEGSRMNTRAMFVKVRNKLLTFPPLDVDFGSVSVATAKFFEAADPCTMKPACSVCGSLFDEPEPADVPPPLALNEGQQGLAAPKPLIVPLVVRRCIDMYWLLVNHANLMHTVLLQLRYASDVVLSFGYAFGDYEPHQGDDPVAQHLHLVASVAGAISAAVSLVRVHASAPL
jgi:hypothetical protein